MSYHPQRYPASGPAASHQSLTPGTYASGSQLLHHQQVGAGVQQHQHHQQQVGAGVGPRHHQQGGPGTVGLGGRPGAGTAGFMGGGRPAVYNPNAAGSVEQQQPQQQPQQHQVVRRTGSFEPFAGGLVSVPRTLEAAVPTAPRVVALMPSAGAVHVPLASLHLSIEIQMTVAFVKLRGVWQNMTSNEVDCIFELPTPKHCQVTSATVRLQGGQAYRTAVVDSEALAKELKRGAVKENAELESALEGYMKQMGGGFRPGEYDPDVFRLPFTKVPPGAQATVEVSLFQDLAYFEGQYRLSIPLTFPDGVIMNPNLNEVLTLDVVVNTGTANCRHTGASHPLSVLQAEGVQHMVMRSNNAVTIPNKDFVLAYEVNTPCILSNLLVQRNSNGDGGNFCLFLAPPQRQDSHLPAFPRRIVFIVDNSGSMYGKAMQAAIDALIGCLDMLAPEDEFAICVFHEYQDWFDPTGAMAAIAKDRPASAGTGRNAVIAPPTTCMMRAGPENLAMAKAFARGITAGGLTDILHPVQQAFGLLEAVSKERPSSFAVPTVFLMTDGAVPNEREVCKYVQDTPLPARVFTLGIGTLCNTYFLRMLAQIGRGYTASSLRFHSLRDDILELMGKMSVPVLLDVTLGMSVQNAQVFPNPIPDLFVGSPVVISGSFSGEFPSSIVLKGRIPSAAGGQATQNIGLGGRLTQLQAGWGVGYEITVPASPTQTIPLDKVFTKQRLDLMIAADWLAGADLKSQARKDIVRISESESVPCPYTSMVLVPDASGGAGAGAGAGGDGGGAGAGAGSQNETKQQAPQQNAGKGRSSNMGLVIGATAGVLVLGAGIGAAVAFGNIGGTISNAVGMADFGGMGGFDVGDFAGNIADCSCCDSIPCVPSGCGGECGKCWGSHEGVLDICFGNCGDSCQECGAAIGGFFSNCFGDMGNCFGDCYSVICKCNISAEPPAACADCGPCSSCAAGFSEVFGSVGQCLGGCCGGLAGAAGSMCNTVGDCTSGCCSAYSDFCQSLSCDCSGLSGGCSDVCGSLGECVGGITSCLGGAVSCVGDLVGGGCGCFGDVLGCLGDSVGDIFDCLNKL